MDLPNKATKHITASPAPIGTVKDGKVKVLDGDTQKTSWRSGKKGMLKDFDGEPTSTQHNLKDLKPRPGVHHPRTGARRQKHVPHDGSKE